ncbi:MAG: hypothetical protein LIO71_07420 [Ruminococcus sp.]|nr:hypothetical protein [Ruminococcus sp.]
MDNIEKEDINNNISTSEDNTNSPKKKKKSILTRILIVLSILLLGGIFMSFVSPNMLEKPVIYLYPTEETQVEVSVNIKDGHFTCTYPKYENGWSVTAEPNGTIYDSNGDEYYCLYWEGQNNIDYNMSKGFVVKGQDTADFLREKLLYMGLTPKETNEFIIYWLPQMEENPYNLITFQNDIYSENVELIVNPTPDSVLRVFMVYKPLDEFIQIEEQELSTFERTGFSVIEWGGSVIN